MITKTKYRSNDGGAVFYDCGKCLAEAGTLLSKGPQSYARLEVCTTQRGIQIRCLRHDVNVMHLDFAGRKIDAYFSAAGDFTKYERAIW